MYYFIIVLHPVKQIRLCQFSQSSLILVILVVTLACIFVSFEVKKKLLLGSIA